MLNSKVEIDEKCMISLALLYNYIANDKLYLHANDVSDFINYMNNLLTYYKTNYIIKKIKANNENFGFSVIDDGTMKCYLLESLEIVREVYKSVIPTEIVAASLKGFQENKDLENPLLTINVDGNKLILKKI